VKRSVVFLFNILLHFLQETTLSSVDGDARGWTGPSELDEHLLEKIDIPDREINDTLKSGAKKEGGNVTMVRAENAWVRDAYTSGYIILAVFLG